VLTHNVTSRRPTPSLHYHNRAASPEQQTGTAPRTVRAIRKTLDFQLLTEHVPDGFLRQDLAKSASRHLLLVTEQQLQLLSKTKTW